MNQEKLQELKRVIGKVVELESILCSGNSHLLFNE